MRIAVNAQLMAASSDYRRTGVSRYIEELLTALPAALAPDDDLVVFGRPGVAPAVSFSDAWRPAHVPTGRPPVRIIWEQTALPWHTWRVGADVLHGALNVIPFVAPCPTVVTIHDLGFLHFPELVPEGRRRYLALATRWAAHHADGIIAVSEFTKQDVINILGAHAERIAVIPLAVDRSFRPPSDAALRQFRTKHKLDRPYLLAVGTLEPRKNLSVLIRAFAALAPEIPHQLVLVGAEGWLTGELHETLRSQTIQDRIRMTGFVPADELPLWYGGADLFVFPSLFEGFGLPPLEAMACGTPVVTSNAASLPEVVGDAALTFPPTDVAALVEAIRRVLTDSKLAESLRQRGLSRAAAFSWERTAAATVDVYREAAGQ